MPPRSQAQAIRDLEHEFTVLDARLDALKTQVADAGWNNVRERLTLAEYQLAELRRANEESARRSWQLTILFFGSIATLLVNLALVFVRK